MEKKSFYSAMILAAGCMASCSSEYLEDMAPRSERNVAFITNVGHTRALTTATNLDQFSVTSYLTQSGATKKYIDKQQIVKSGSNWVAAGSQIVWPHSGTMRFYAFAPTNLKFEMSAADEQQPTLNFTVAKNNESQNDLLYAVEEADCSQAYEGANAKKVVLNFRHALSALQFVAKNDNENWMVNVSKVTLCNVAASGRLTLPAAVTTTSNETADKSIWTVSDQHGSTLDIRSNKYVDIPKDGVCLNSDNEPLFVIPQTCHAWNPKTDPLCEEEGAYFIIDCTIVHKETGIKLWPKDDKDTDYGVAIPVPDNTTWEPGKKYVYTINFTNFGGYIPPIYRDDPGQEVIPVGAGTQTLQQITFDVKVDDFHSPNDRVLDL